jgi:hypothetical protein
VAVVALRDGCVEARLAASVGAAALVCESAGSAHVIGVHAGEGGHGHGGAVTAVRAQTCRLKELATAAVSHLSACAGALETLHFAYAGYLAVLQQMAKQKAVQAAAQECCFAHSRQCALLLMEEVKSGSDLEVVLPQLALLPVMPVASSAVLLVVLLVQLSVLARTWHAQAALVPQKLAVMAAPARVANLCHVARIVVAASCDWHQIACALALAV